MVYLGLDSDKKSAWQLYTGLIDEFGSERGVEVSGVKRRTTFRAESPLQGNRLS